MDNTALDLEVIEARCEAARCEVNRLCRGDTSWTMSTPVREDDTDIILTNSFRDVLALVAEVKQLRAGRMHIQLRTHYEGCWRHMGHHACAVTRVEQLVAKLERLRQEQAEIHWVEVKQLRQARHDAQVRRDEWEKMYNQAVTGTEVERLQAELDQVRQSTFQEIIALRAKLMQTRVELNCMRVDMQDQSDEVQELWLSPCEASGLRLRLKHAEDIRDFWIKEHDALLQPMRHERQLRREAERHAETLECERDEWRGDWESATAKLLNAKVLAALVTPKLALLLRRLAIWATAHADSSASPRSSWVLRRRAEIKDARELAAKIREALGEH